MSQQERLDHLRRVLAHDDLHVAHRLVAVLVLLFGQPISKIVRLRRDDVTVTADAVTLRLSDDPLTLPAPVAELMTAFLADPRYRRNTAANRDSPWLFPGTSPGRLLHTSTAPGTCCTTPASPPSPPAPAPGSNSSAKHHQRSSPTRSAST